MMKKIFQILFLLASPVIASAQVIPYSDVVLNARGMPAGGASIAVCANPGFLTTGAQVISNTAVLTFATSPITAGFAANQSLMVTGFTGADTYFNGGSIVNGAISGGFTILSVTSTTITYQLVHANASASSFGSAFQEGNQSTSCAPLSTIYSDPNGLNQITQPGFIADALGNFSFYTAAGNYFIQMYGPVLVTRVKPVAIGGGGTGGNGTVGPGTVNAIAKFTAANVVGNSSCVDDGLNPTRCPNGINTANGPLSDEWPVGPGGVLANHLACRVPTNNAQVQICPAGATLTVIGVAQATAASGSNMIIEYGAKANVCSTNNTAVNDWLIPSVTTPGCVDDTGSTTPPTSKTFAWPAETAVTGGSNVLITNASLDTLVQIAAGGNLPSCLLYSLIYESGVGTGAAYSCINAPTTPNGAVYGLFSTPTGGVATNWQKNQFGVLPRVVSGTTDTIGCTDVAPGAVPYTNSGAVTVTVPDLGSTCFANHPVFKVIVNSSGTVTFNHTSTSNFWVATGNGTPQLVTNFPMKPGTFATFEDAGDGNWLVTETSVSQTSTLGPPSPTWQNLSGSPTIGNGDYGYRDRPTTSAATITLGQPNSITANPIVARRVNTTTNVSPFTTPPFAQSSGNQLLIIISNYNVGATPIVNSVTDSALDVFNRLIPDVTGGTGSTSISVWYATGIAAAGANTVTINYAATPGNSYVFGFELTGTTFDDGVSSIAASTLTAQVHFANALGIAIQANGNNNLGPAGWVTIYGTGTGQDDYVRYLQNTSQLTILDTTASYPIGLLIFSMAATPSFTPGWYFTEENASLGNQTTTPTGSTINGRASITTVPNEICSPMSNGTNYDAVCGFAPDLQTPGVIGAAIQNNGVFTANAVADVGATTLVTNGAQDALWQVNASIVCKSSVNASETLTILYTDTNSISQTKTASTGTCNGGTPADGDILATMMVKASTVLQYQTTHTTATPTYDVRVMFSQVSTK